MIALVKNVLLPILIVLGAVVSCTVAICFYQCMQYIAEVKKLKQSKHYETIQSTDDEETIISEPDDSIIKSPEDSRSDITAPKSSLKRKISLSSSIATYSTIKEPVQVNNLGDIEGFLRLREILINQVYNYDRKYLQLTIRRVTLYPLPGNVAEIFSLQYKISFSIPNSDIFESDLRPLREQIRFDETYRFYPAINDINGASMTCDVFIVEQNFKRTHKWTVVYTLKAESAWLTDDQTSIPEDREFGTDLERISRIDCIRNRARDEPQPKVLISMCYKPTSGRIFMKLIEGMDFPETAHDMRLRVVLVQTRYGSVRTFVTPIMNNTRSPSINEVFTLAISIKNIQSAIIIVSLLYGINQKAFSPIAEAKIGSTVSSQAGQHHWNDMLSSVREDIEAWHPLIGDINEK